MNARDFPHVLFATDTTAGPQSLPELARLLRDNGMLAASWLVDRHCSEVPELQDDAEREQNRAEREQDRADALAAGMEGAQIALADLAGELQDLASALDNRYYDARTKAEREKLADELSAEIRGICTRINTAAGELNPERYTD